MDYPAAVRWLLFGFPFQFFSSARCDCWHIYFVYTFKLTLNCYAKKAAKTKLDFVVYTCIVELMQFILHLIYTYSKIFKFEHNLLHLNNGGSWLYICCTHICIYISTQILHYYGYTFDIHWFSYILYTIKLKIE